MEKWWKCLYGNLNIGYPLIVELQVVFIISLLIYIF